MIGAFHVPPQKRRSAGLNTRRVGGEPLNQRNCRYGSFTPRDEVPEVSDRGGRQRRKRHERNRPVQDRTSSFRARWSRDHLFFRKVPGMCRGGQERIGGGRSRSVCNRL